MTKLSARGALTTAYVVGAFALLSSAAMGQAGPVQTAANTTAGGLEEVVVTARYREENLQQTPIAISAITADDIQQRGFTTATDIGYAVPNASLRPAQAAFGNSMTAYIRGVGQYDFNFAFEPGVGIYVDDIYYPTLMGSQLDLMDLERVEVLRGPQGTLFGRGSIGGAIRYVSKQPAGSDTGFIEGTVGDFHRVDLRAGYDFSIIPDKLFARITGVSKKQDGYQKQIDFACEHPDQAGTLPALTHNRNGGCQIGTLGGTDVAGARAVLRYVINDNADINVALDYQRDDSESRADTLLGVGPFIPPVAAWDQLMFSKYGVHYDNRFLTGNPLKTYATFSDPYSGLSFPPKTSVNQKGISGTLNWKLTDDISAKLITAWRNWNSYFSTDQDDSPLGFSVVDGIEHFTYRTAELEFSGKLFGRLEWTAGGFYYHGNGSSAQQVELPAFGNLARYGSDPTGYTFQPGTGETIPNSLLVDGFDVGRFENVSGFLHGVYSVTDAWRFTVGARYSSDKKHDDFDNTVFKAPIDSNQTHFDWLVGTDYKITDSTMAYVSASTGYRPPAYNPRPFQASQFIAVRGESMKAYEVGIKSDLFDHRMRVNAAAFYNDYSQRIVPVGGVECLNIPGTNTPIPGCPVLIPKTDYQNSPGKISGGELELTYRPVDPFTITASAGYTKFTASNAVTGGITPNGAPIYVPKWNGAASAQYVFSLQNGATLTPRWDAYLQTQICSSTTSVSSCSGGYTLHNARLEYAANDRKWVAAAGVNNAFNKAYYLNIFDLTPFGEPTIEGQPGMPRAWFFQLTRNFH